METRQVGIGFLLVLGTGVVLSWSSIATALQDVVCRVHFLQLKYLIITLTLCSFLNLFFNISVLRIAKKQLTVICATAGTGDGRTRPLSVICSNCGHTTEATVTTLTTVPIIPVICLPMESTAHVMANVTSELALPLPIIKSEVTPFLESSLHPIFENLETHSFGGNSADEMSTSIIRTASLPEILPTTPIHMGSEEDCMRGMMESELSCPMETTASLGDDTDVTPLPHPQLPRRTRSLFSCNSLVTGRNPSHSHTLQVPVGTRIQFFRNLHFNRAHVFHVRLKLTHFIENVKVSFLNGNYNLIF